MSLSVGIVGLPNVGKSTLFNALLGRQIAKAESYPFCTIEPNTGVVEVPDSRLGKIASIVDPGRTISSVIKFIDIAGLVKGAHKGLGLGNQFLSHIRNCDAVLYLLRDFDLGVPMPESISPLVDLEVLKTELALKDIETLEKMVGEKVSGEEKKIRKELAGKLSKQLQDGALAKDISLSGEERGLVDQFCLLTDKPFLVVVNVAESADFVSKAKEYSKLAPIVVSAKFEVDAQKLSETDRKELLSSKEYQSALDQIIAGAYQTLDLLSFYTIKGGKECRAWPLKKGSSVLAAADLVHTDFAKKFVRAEVASYADFVKFGGWEAVARAGKLRTEGRDYQVVDGDVIEVKIGN